MRRLLVAAALVLITGSWATSASAQTLPNVNLLIVNVPAGTDFSGDLHGSKHGFPNWPVDDAKVVETARYFDAMNFASSITAQSLVAFGFIETTSPPYGVLSAFNRIQGPKEAAPMPESDHNNITPQKEGAFITRSKAALDELRTTGHFTPDPDGLKP